MNHDDLGNYSHSYVADLRAQLQAANERAQKAEHQSKLAWARHAEKDRAYGQALEARDAATAKAESWARDCGHQADQYSSLNAAYQQLSELYAASEQTNAALKAEVERLTKKCDEWKACAERVDARMLHEQSDHNKTVDRLIAARALNDRLAGALMAIPPCDVSMDASFVYKTSGWRWAEAMEKRAVALSAYAKSKEAQP